MKLEFYHERNKENRGDGVNTSDLVYLDRNAGSITT